MLGFSKIIWFFVIFQSVGNFHDTSMWVQNSNAIYIVNMMTMMMMMVLMMMKMKICDAVEPRHLPRYDARAQIKAC